MTRGWVATEVLCVDEGGARPRDDRLALEEPLLIRLAGAAPTLTMRTPGHDRELAAGLLLSEGLARRPDDLADMRLMDGEDALQVTLRDGRAAAAAALERGALMNSACGVCGKTELSRGMLDAAAPLPAGASVAAAVLPQLPGRLRLAQGVFNDTGGLHAAALFTAQGELLALREDVGRHNALDKLLGWALLDGRLPLNSHIVLLSGRASYELLQKAVMAGVTMECAISAPSSYAVRLAREYGVTLVGFLRGRRYNIYSRPDRISGLGAGEGPLELSRKPFFSS